MCTAEHSANGRPSRRSSARRNDSFDGPTDVQQLHPTTLLRDLDAVETILSTSLQLVWQSMKIGLESIIDDPAIRNMQDCDA